MNVVSGTRFPEHVIHYYTQYELTIQTIWTSHQALCGYYTNSLYVHLQGQHEEYPICLACGQLKMRYDVMRELAK